MNILFIQYGDYREAFNSLMSGGSETYKAQLHSVNFVADLKKIRGHDVCVICVNSAVEYDEILANGIRVVGFKNANANKGTLVKAIESFAATHIVLRTPLPFIVEHCLKHKINLLPLFADYFSNKNIRSWYNNKKLARLLSNGSIKLVSNHNYPACESLARLGVAKEKIVPWDWAATLTPDGYPNKTLRQGNIRLLYVGAVSNNKGCFDCINAMKHLADSTQSYSLHILGPGDLETARMLAAQLPKPENVQILGAVVNSQVIAEMAAADIVIVPSRHEYPEGMPNTVYEGLITKTPLIVSDHPVFAERFKENEEVVFFKAAQPESLAEKIEYLANEPKLYEALSNNAKSLWLKLQMPLKWDALISGWLEGESAVSEMRAKYALSVTKK
jgi:glycosyltransferase involved in cell wall biosynthesis